MGVQSIIGWYVFWHMISRSVQVLQIKFLQLEQEDYRVGLKVKENKNKYMIASRKENMCVCVHTESLSQDVPSLPVVMQPPRAI